MWREAITAAAVSPEVLHVVECDYSVLADALLAQ